MSVELFWIWVHAILLTLNAWMLTLPTWPRIKVVNGLLCAHEVFWIGWNACQIARC